MSKSNECASCGRLGAPGELHTWTHCALAKAGYSRETIRANIGALLETGQCIERAGLSRWAVMEDMTRLYRAEEAPK